MFSASSWPRYIYIGWDVRALFLCVCGRTWVKFYYQIHLCNPTGVDGVMVKLTVPLAFCVHRWYKAVCFHFLNCLYCISYETVTVVTYLTVFSSFQYTNVKTWDSYELARIWLYHKWFTSDKTLVLLRCLLKVHPNLSNTLWLRFSKIGP